MKTLFTPLLLTLFICINSSSTFAQSGILDGNSYTITVTQESGKKHHPFKNWPVDTLKFDSGKMYSIYMQEKERFHPALYSPPTNISNPDGLIHFKYESQNPGGSFLRIEGTVQSDKITGSIRWTSIAKNRTRTYSYEGVLN